MHSFLSKCMGKEWGKQGTGPILLHMTIEYRNNINRNTPHHHVPCQKRCRLSCFHGDLCTWCSWYKLYTFYWYSFTPLSWTTLQLLCLPVSSTTYLSCLHDVLLCLYSHTTKEHCPFLMVAHNVPLQVIVSYSCVSPCLCMSLHVSPSQKQHLGCLTGIQ